MIGLSILIRLLARYQGQQRLTKRWWKKPRHYKKSLREHRAGMMVRI